MNTTQKIKGEHPTVVCKEHKISENNLIEKSNTGNKSNWISIQPKLANNIIRIKPKLQRNLEKVKMNLSKTKFQTVSSRKTDRVSRRINSKPNIGNFTKRGASKKNMINHISSKKSFKDLGKLHNDVSDILLETLSRYKSPVPSKNIANTMGERSLRFNFENNFKLTSSRYDNCKPQVRICVELILVKVFTICYRICIQLVKEHKASLQIFAFTHSYN